MLIDIDYNKLRLSILALRPAALQCAWLAHPGTTGAAASFALSGVAAPTAAIASSDAGDAAINPLGGVIAVADVVARPTVPRVARAAVEASVIAVFIYDGGDVRAIGAVVQAGAISRERARRRQGEEQNGAEAEAVRPHRCP